MLTIDMRSCTKQKNKVGTDERVFGRLRERNRPTLFHVHSHWSIGSNSLQNNSRHTLSEAAVHTTSHFQHLTHMREDKQFGLRDGQSKQHRI